jgi:transcriptional regulator with XRE-family HTH domain
VSTVPDRGTLDAQNAEWDSGQPDVGTTWLRASSPWSTGRMATTTTDHRAALAEFLRARREAVTPDQVGLPASRSRRTPGLRREEVALLAGVSITWYTWLEQGRRINASADVLRAIGRALRLDDAGIEHLTALGQPAAPSTAVPLIGPDDVPSALRRLIDAFEPAPAYVLGPRWEFAAWNSAQARLYPPIETLPDEERNLLWVLFADPYTRRLIVDWDIHARQALAEFRASTTPLRDDVSLGALIDRLLAVSPEFEQWWPEHDVARFETRIRRFDHPNAGILTFEYQLLAPAEWPALTVAVQLPVPGDDSAQRLAVRHHVV